jgi:hypothetical protein
MTSHRRRNPLLFPLTHWNWKAALLTAIFRAAACMVALWHSPLPAREHFGAVEAAYVLATAGIFSAWQQQAMELKPRFLAWLTVVLAVPLGSLAADSALHLWLDRGSMSALGLGALAATLLSAMFHWHLLQNGAMRVGDESGSFLHDMRRMPQLTITFVCNPILLLIASLRFRRTAAQPGDFEVVA